MARSESELLELVADVVNDVAGVDKDTITPEKSLVDDLDVDSLSIVEIVVALEGELGVTIPDSDVKGLKTVGDIVAYLSKKGE